ncbi:MAG: CpsD/CapB family tyrosine-protein kinase [Methanobacterium sp.]|nr:CpsD/CapB family tyrosine-protein kinase [Methanobacterium sp.]
MKVVDTDMYMADLRGRRDRNPSCAKLDEIHPFLDEFRRHFDMVIMVAPPADSEPLGLVLAGHVDGNILVIEADQTRRSAAIRLREILARCRRPILGAVLHNRRDHGPHWMTRLL